MFEDPSSFSRAKELGRRAEDLFKAQDKHALGLKGDAKDAGTVRILTEPSKQGLGKIYSADPDDQKQILGEVQERICINEKSLKLHGEQLNEVKIKINRIDHNIQQISNAIESNANGREPQQSYRGNNDSGGPRRGKKPKSNAMCTRCNTSGHTMDRCWRTSCSCGEWHNRSNLPLPTCVKGRPGPGADKRPKGTQSAVTVPQVPAGVSVLNAIFEVTPDDQLYRKEDRYREPLVDEDQEVQGEESSYRHVVNRAMDCIDNKTSDIWTPCVPDVKVLTSSMEMLEHSCYLSGTRYRGFNVIDQQEVLGCTARKSFDSGNYNHLYHG